MEVTGLPQPAVEAILAFLRPGHISRRHHKLRETGFLDGLIAPVDLSESIQHPWVERYTILTTYDRGKDEHCPDSIGMEEFAPGLTSTWLIGGIYGCCLSGLLGDWCEEQEAKRLMYNCFRPENKRRKFS